MECFVLLPVHRGRKMSEENSQGQVLLTQKIIWGTLLASQVVYLGLVVLGVAASESEPESILPILLFVIGLVEIGVGTFGVPLFIKPSEETKGVEAFSTQRIISWAMIEGGLVMGLVNCFLGGPQIVFYGLYVVSILGMIKTFPQDVSVQSSGE